MENEPFDEHRDRADDEFEPFPPTDARKAEIDRRLAELDRDPESAIPREEVREKLHKRFE